MKYKTISLQQIFGVKGTIYYEAIATVIFSHVKISIFRTKAHPVFHWCLYNNKAYYHGPQAPSFLTTFTLGGWGSSLVAWQKKRQHLFQCIKCINYANITVSLTTG